MKDLSTFGDSKNLKIPSGAYQRVTSAVTRKIILKVLVQKRSHFERSSFQQSGIAEIIP